MGSPRWISVTFWVTAVYDGVLGLAFLLFGSSIFDAFEITPPNHYGYIQFPAALLVVFALMFVAIARNPVPQRQLIIYGILFKFSYCGVVFYHWFASGLPWIWKPFAICDAVFLILFIVADRRLRIPVTAASSS